MASVQEQWGLLNQFHIFPMSVQNSTLPKLDGAPRSHLRECTEMAVAWAKPIDTAVPALNWYCVHTKPLREKQAVEQLSAHLGFEVYFPRIRIQKTIRRVRRQVTEPLFPRYLFCRFDISSHYRAVRYAHDVVNLVSFGDEPAVVAGQLIEDLKSWAGENRFFTPAPAFSSGDHVQIAFGPMQGLQAVILEARSDSERVAVLLSILGCEARLTIDRGQLARAI
jgi:transcriptional antiterminator RfaH